MKRKTAIISVELVDESIEETNDKIKQELLDWFQDSTYIPWVKSVKNITVKDP